MGDALQELRKLREHTAAMSLMGEALMPVRRTKRHSNCMKLTMHDS